MSPAATVEGDERLRLFFGLPLPDDVTAGLSVWQQQTFGGMPGVRAVEARNLHVTLAFLGGRPRAEVPALREALAAAAAGCRRPALEALRYRETERVAMVVFADDGDRAGALQRQLAERLAVLGVYRPERRPWLAHVTVARLRRRPRLRPPLPAVGVVSPSDAALYHSSLRPDGAQYQILEAVSLGG